MGHFRRSVRRSARRSREITSLVQLHRPTLLDGFEQSERQKHALARLVVGKWVLALATQEAFPSGHLFRVPFGIEAQGLLLARVVDDELLVIGNLANRSGRIDGEAFLRIFGIPLRAVE